MYLPNVPTILTTWLAAFQQLSDPQAPLNITSKQNAKRGIAHKGWKLYPKDVQHVAHSKISWEYDWETDVPPKLPEDVEHVPMQWGTDDVEALATKVKDQKAKVVLGFNEPEALTQANISPKDAAALWKKHVNPLKKKYGKDITIVSPAISSAPEGVDWLNGFFAECAEQCYVDHVALHWYGTGVENFIGYLKVMHEKYPDRKIWVTEFADNELNQQAVIDFMKEALDFLDKTDWIARYAWYVYDRTSIGMNSHLCDITGNLNELGKLYVNGDSGKQ